MEEASLSTLANQYIRTWLDNVNSERKEYLDKWKEEQLELSSPFRTIIHDHWYYEYTVGGATEHVYQLIKQYCRGVRDGDPYSEPDYYCCFEKYHVRKHDGIFQISRCDCNKKVEQVEQVERVDNSSNKFEQARSSKFTVKPWIERKHTVVSSYSNVPPQPVSQKQ